jgi:hypothetical protein
VTATAFNDLQVYTAGATQGPTVNGELTVNGTLTLFRGKLDGGTVHAKGDVGQAHYSFESGSSTLIIDGDADQTLSGSAITTNGSLPALIVNKSAGTLTLSGTIRTSKDWTHVEGTVDPGTSEVVFGGYRYLTGGQFHDVRVNVYGTSARLTVFGDVAVTGTLTLDQGTLYATGDGTLGVGGDVVSSGGYLGGSGTLVLNGTGGQVVQPGSITGFDLTVQNTAGTVTFLGDVSAKTLSLPAGAHLVFDNTASYSFATISGNGTDTQPVTLRSDVAGQPWSLVVGTPFLTLYHYDVQDSDASGGPTITAFNSTDSGNNTNWVFASGGALIDAATGTTSQTSPAWVEGTCGVDATSVTVTVNGGQPFDAVRRSPAGWYVDNASAGGASLGLTLSSTAATEVTVTASNGTDENSINQSITWSSTHLDTSPDPVKVRKGDSLLLTASTAGTTLEIDADGDGTTDYTGAPGDLYAYQYATAGTYTAKAKVDGVEVGTLSVTVVDVDLKGPIACEVTYQRRKGVTVVPVAQVESVAFTPNHPELLGTSVYRTLEDGAELNVKANASCTPVLEARVGGASGAIVARQEVDEFTVDLSSKEMLVILGSTREGTAKLTMTPHVPGLSVSFEMFASQSTFVRDGDHVSEFTVSTDSFTLAHDHDAGATVGEYLFQIHVPEGETCYCFRVKFSQGDTPSQQVSQTITGNGTVEIAKAEMGGAVLFVREDNNEDFDTSQHTEQPTENWESHGNNPDDPVQQRRLSYIEYVAGDTWRVAVDTDKLSGSATDRSYSGPDEPNQYVSRGNFKSYVPPYATGQDGENFSWPLAGQKQLVGEVKDRAVPYVPGVQHGKQEFQYVGVPKPGTPHDVRIVRLEVDGAVPVDSDLPASNSNVTSSTRDRFPKLIGEVPDRPIEYDENDAPKPTAIIGFAQGQKVWSSSGTLTVQFDGTASQAYGESSQIAEYQWDFDGDGEIDQTTTGPQATHQYTAPGVYCPRLVVKDSADVLSEADAFERIIVHTKDTDPEPDPPDAVDEPLGRPVQVTVRTEPYTSVDIKVRITVDTGQDPDAAAYLSLSGRRKAVNTPEYLRLTTDATGCASRVIYVQGVHYNTVSGSVKFIVAGKELVESAKAAPTAHFEWETSQTDDDGEPFVYTDEEHVEICRLQFVDASAPDVVLPIVQTADAQDLRALRNNAVNPDPQPGEYPPGTDPTEVYGSDLSAIEPEIEALTIADTERNRISGHVSGLVLKLTGDGFLKTATVSFGNEDVTVNSVTWNSVSELEVSVDTSTDALARCKVTVANPNGKSASMEAPVHIGRACDFGTAASPVEPSYERLEVVAKSAQNKIGYEDTTDITAVDFGAGTSLLRDGHRSTRSNTRVQVDLPAGGYEVRLILGDASQQVGPVTVTAAGTTLAQDLTIPAGQTETVVGTAGLLAAGTLSIDLTRTGGVTTIRGLEIFRADGSGSLGADKKSDEEIRGLLVNVSSTVTFHVRSGEFDLSGGAVRLVLPDGITAPQVSNPTGAGYVSLTVPQGVQASGLAVDGQVISFTTDTFPPGQSLDVVYGDTTQGGTGIQVEDAAVLNVGMETKGRDGAWQAVARAPAYWIECVEEGQDFFLGSHPDDSDADLDAPPQAHDPRPGELPEKPSISRFRLKIVGSEAGLAYVTALRFLVLDAAGGTMEEADLVTEGNGGQRTSTATILLSDAAVNAETEAYFNGQGDEVVTATADHADLCAVVLGGDQEVIVPLLGEYGSPALVPKVYLDAQFATELSYYRQEKRKVAQLKTEKEVHRWVWDSPKYSVPVDTTLHAWALVPEKLLKQGGKVQLKLRTKTRFGSVENVTKDANLVGKQGKAAVIYAAQFNIKNDQLTVGEASAYVAVLVGGQQVGEAQRAMYDTREMGFLCGANDRDDNAAVIFNVVKNHEVNGKKLSEEYEVRHEELFEEYDDHEWDCLTDLDIEDRKFDQVDLSFEVMHGLPGVIKRYRTDENDKLYTVNVRLRDVLAGVDNCEWGVFYSCRGFEKAGDGKKVVGLYPLLFRYGLHVAMGGVTCMHSNRHLMKPRFEEKWVKPILQGPAQPIASVWCSTVAFGKHGYRWAWSGELKGGAFAPRLRLAGAPVNAADALPVGVGAVSLSPDFECIESQDVDVVATSQPPAEEFPVTITNIQYQAGQDPDHFTAIMETETEGVRLADLWAVRLLPSVGQFASAQVLEKQEVNNVLKLKVKFSELAKNKFAGKESKLRICGYAAYTPYFGQEATTLNP